MPTIHVIAPFHTVPSTSFSHCAFTGKALRFAKMMKPFGYTIVEYANRGSESEADVKVVMLNEAEYKQFYSPETKSPGAQARVDTPGYAAFNTRLVKALDERARPGDIIAHIWSAHDSLVRHFPHCIHVETGIGYPNDAFGAYRIFESEAWRHYQWGRVGSPGGVLPVGRPDINPARTWIVPNYFDVAEWPFSETPGNNVAFMSRFVVDKGIDMLREIIKLWNEKHPDDGVRFTLAGMGDYVGWLTGSNFSPEEMARIDYSGPVIGTNRATFVGNAFAFLLPSIFVEPFGGAAVEAMLVGTPAITPDFGAFTETIENGVNGFRCRTVEEYVVAIEKARELDRAAVRQRAMRYSLEACGVKYHEIFTFLLSRASAE